MKKPRHNLMKVGALTPDRKLPEDPPGYFTLGVDKATGEVNLNRDTTVYDRIRNELDAAGLLNDDYKHNPERLITVDKMGKGNQAEALIKTHAEQCDKMYLDSLTLKPFTQNQGSIVAEDGMLRIALHLTAPEVFVITLE